MSHFAVTKEDLAGLSFDDACWLALRWGGRRVEATQRVLDDAGRPEAAALRLLYGEAHVGESVGAWFERLPSALEAIVARVDDPAARESIHATKREIDDLHAPLFRGRVVKASLLRATDRLFDQDSGDGALLARLEVGACTRGQEQPRIDQLVTGWLGEPDREEQERDREELVALGHRWTDRALGRLAEAAAATGCAVVAHDLEFARRMAPRAFGFWVDELPGGLRALRGHAEGDGWGHRNLRALLLLVEGAVRPLHRAWKDGDEEVIRGLTGALAVVAMEVHYACGSWSTTGPVLLLRDPLEAMRQVADFWRKDGLDSDEADVPTPDPCVVPLPDTWGTTFPQVEIGLDRLARRAAAAASLQGRAIDEELAAVRSRARGLVIARVPDHVRDEAARWPSFAPVSVAELGPSPLRQEICARFDAWYAGLCAALGRTPEGVEAEAEAARKAQDAAREARRVPLPEPHASEIRALVLGRLPKAATLEGLGTLSVSIRRGFTGTNPLTGQVMDVPARHIPVFRCDKEFRDALNGDGAPPQSPVRAGPAAAATATLRDLLLGGADVTVPGLGHFSRDTFDGFAGKRTLVHFRASRELKRLLNPDMALEIDGDDSRQDLQDT